MVPRRRSAAHRALTCALLLSLGVSGCVTWQPADPPAVPVPGQRLRARTPSTSWTEMRGAYMEGDSVLSGLAVPSGERVRFPLDPTLEVQTHRANAAGIITTVVLTPLVILAVLLVANRNDVYTVAPGGAL